MNNNNNNSNNVTIKSLLSFDGDGGRSRASAAKSTWPMSRGSIGEGTGTGTAPPGRFYGKKISKVRGARWMLIFFLVVVTAVFGVLTFYLLTESEEALAETQYESIADRALDTSLEIALRQKQGLVTLSSMAEQTFPNASTWPNVNFQGFEVFANNLIKTYSSDPATDVGFLTLVVPGDLDEFNEFASALRPDAPFDRVTGLYANFTRYNESDGSSWWGSPYRVLTPFLEHSRGPILYLANLHSLPTRGGQAIDQMITCSIERAEEMNSEAATAEDYTPKECSIVQNITDLSREEVVVPAGITYQPIYADDGQVLVGLLTSAIRWVEVLHNVFSNEVSGIDCVLETDMPQAYTFHITNGIATLRGEGDLHERLYSKWGRSVVLTEEGLYSDFSARYTITLYPSDELIEVYSTDNPKSATIGAVCIIFFISLLFFLYDCFVRQEFQYKDRLSKAKRQFVNFISHEVRTPLNSVCMGLSILKDDCQRRSREDSATMHDTTASSTAPDERKEASSDELATKPQETKVQNDLESTTDLCDDILMSARSAVDVLNDLLNYDKVESKSLHLELTIIDIWQLIDRTCHEFFQQAHVKDIKIVMDMSALQDEIDDEAKVDAVNSALHLPQEILDRKVVGDTSRISQVLRNLVSNALKFTPEHGGLTIRTTWQRKRSGEATSTSVTLHSGETKTFLDSGFLQVEVTDTGAGMSTDQLKNLFREGVQFNVNRLQAGQGSGLGLYIAKGILEQHGGSLEAASEGLGLGTTFTMTAPLYYVPSTSTSFKQEDDWHREGAGANEIQPLNMLVVDDSTMNRKMLVRLLKNRGHTCTEAEDGVVAVERVKESMSTENPYACILLDNQMPNLSGPDAAKQMRKMGCDSFIAGVTGNLFKEDVAHFKDSGANMVLPKPLDIDVLVDALLEHGVAGF